jgi:hypothetical protein
MAKLSLRLTGLSLFLTGGTLALACGGGETTDGTGLGGAATGGGFTATGGTASGGAATGGAATGGAATGGATSGAYTTTCIDAVCSADPVIDDFTDGNLEISTANGTTGYWYSYTVDNATGQPAIGVDITQFGDSTVVSGKLPVVATGLAAGLAAGFGTELNTVSTVACGVDASAYAGIRVTIKGVTGQSLNVTAIMPDVVPVESKGTCATSCWDMHYKKKTFASDTAEVWEIPWSDFEQQGWGTPVTFDPKRITKLQFVSTTGATEFSVELDEVSFYGTGTGTCNMGGSGSM